MKNKPPFLLQQISQEDWDKTPIEVKRLVNRLFIAPTGSESDDRLLQFLDATPMGIAVHDETGQLIYINNMGRALFGIEESVAVDSEELSEIFQIYREGTPTLYPPEELPSSLALAGETIWTDDVEVHHREGIVPLEVCATPIFDEQGKVIYAIATFQDISHQKRQSIEKEILQNTLRKNKNRYQQIIQAQTDIILRSLPDTTITFVNETFCNLLGQSFEEILGKKWSQFVPVEDLNELYRKVAALTPDQPTFESINRDYRPHDQIGWTQWINLGIFDATGQLVEVQSVGRDVTTLQQQIQREKALNQVVQAIRNSLDLDTIFATATAETARFLDPLDCFVMQYCPAEAIWKHIAGFSHHDDPSTLSGFEIPDRKNPFAEQLKQFQTVQVQDTTQLDNAVNREVSKTFLGAWLLVPLVVDGSLWGSLTVMSCQGNFPWSQEQINLAQAVANQLEVAIQQANLYQKTQLELAERRRIESALRESETRFKTMAANLPGALAKYVLHPDRSDEFEYLSPGFYLLLAVEAEAMTEETSLLWKRVHPEDVTKVWASLRESARTLERWYCIWRIQTASPEEKWLEAVGQPIQRENGDITWDLLILDITERKKAEQQRRDSEARYRLLAENMNDLVCLHDLDGRYLYVSPSCESLLGYSYTEMLGEDPYRFFHPDDRAQMYEDTHASFLSGNPNPMTYRIRQKSGTYIWFETLTKPITDETGKVIQLQTTSRDVTQRIEAQQQLQHDAFHDALTGLPNRYFFMERLALAINRVQRTDHYQFAVLFLDLDRFKVINDSLGHTVGDQLLITIARKIQSTLRNFDVVARLGGDEFVILLEEVTDIAAAIHYTDRLFHELQNPLTINGHRIYTSTSAGIVLGTKNYSQASDVVRDADLAMYRAKAKGKAQYEIFDLEMHTQAVNRLQLENDLYRAFEREEFRLYYQPIIALPTGRIVGLEALIRWQHPQWGLRTPSQFISVAEEMGLITILDYWALQTACEQLVQWQMLSEQFSYLKVNVNLSSQDLKGFDLIEEVDSVLGDTGLEGTCLTLEITESMLLEDVESTIALLKQLKTRGVQISIDDFGTGYSSLSYLHRLPVDSLKVDRSFVHQMQHGKKNYQIIKTIMALSQQLEISAIAEGIETEQEKVELQKLGYHLGQGYLFSQPLSAEGITTKLNRGLH